MNNKEFELEYLGFKNVKKEDRKVFLALGADYGNVGDLALTIAQETIIKDAFPNRKIVEIPMEAAYNYENEIKKILNDDDICTIIGGGNFGNIYLGWEERRRFIIKNFQNNKIITFPQTIDFSDNNEGSLELQKSVNIYGSHKNLTILAREQKSYNTIKNNFKNRVLLIPDSVFYLKNKIQTENINRENITLCLRNDREKVTNNDMHNILSNLLKKNNFYNISSTDTHIGEVSVSVSKRNQIFNDTLNNFKKSKVIITDRLHGMIFSVITNTPCIAFDNSNKKISATYNTWLKDIPEIKFLETYDEKKVLDYVKELSEITNPQINFNAQLHFSTLFSLLQD